MQLLFLPFGQAEKVWGQMRTAWFLDMGRRSISDTIPVPSQWDDCIPTLSANARQNVCKAYRRMDNHGVFRSEANALHLFFGTAMRLLYPYHRND